MLLGIVVKPATAILPFRPIAAAAFSTNTPHHQASALTPHGVGSSLSKPRREVPLPSQEKPKSVVQYALYAMPECTPEVVC